MESLPIAPRRLLHNASPVRRMVDAVKFSGKTPILCGMLNLAIGAAATWFGLSTPDAGLYIKWSDLSTNNEGLRAVAKG